MHQCPLCWHHLAHWILLSPANHHINNNQNLSNMWTRSQDLATSSKPKIWSPVSFNIMNNQSDCMHEAFQISWILVEWYNWVTALEKHKKTLCHSYLNVLQCKHMPDKPGLSSLFKIQNLGLCHALHLHCYQPRGLAQSLCQRAATPQTNSNHHTWQ